MQSKSIESAIKCIEVCGDKAKRCYPAMLVARRIGVQIEHVLTPPNECPKGSIFLYSHRNHIIQFELPHRKPS